MWKTTKACTAKLQNDNCKIEKGSSIYDLSNLMNLKNNYFIKINDTTRIIFNVCHSLLYGYQSLCPNPHAAACLITKTDNQELK